METRPFESIFVSVRGLRYHCRCWGDPAHPQLFMLHGWKVEVSHKGKR